MANKLVLFYRLRPVERAAIIRTLVFLPMVASCLRFFGVRKTLALLEVSAFQSMGLNHTDTDDKARALIIARSFQRAVQYMPMKATCLPRAIVLWYLLRREGILGEICIGVRKDQKAERIGLENFNAHAWVEYGGLVLNDWPGVHQHYVVFEHLPLGN
jgi:hypothetical protein